MPATSPDQKVIVLDFGAQYGQLIARRVRDLGVYSEIVPCDEEAASIAALKPSAIILSGGPASVYAEDAPKIDPGVLELGVPILASATVTKPLPLSWAAPWATPKRENMVQLAFMWLAVPCSKTPLPNKRFG